MTRAAITEFLKPFIYTHPMKLHTKIGLGLILGGFFGGLCNAFFADQPWLVFVSDNIMFPVGQIFMRMLFMTVVPIVFTSITLGVAGIGDMKTLGRLGGRTFGYFALSTLIAAIIGLTLVNTIKPGSGLPEQTRNELMEKFSGGAQGMLTQIGIMAQEGFESDSVSAMVKAATGAGENGLEVLTWQEAIPEMVGFIEIDDAFLYIYLVVIFAIVAFAIANTFLMAVMERVREFGLLNALGLRGSGVAKLLLTETLLMTALAMSLGFALGFAGHLAASHWGIPVAAWGVEDMEVSGVDFADMVMRSKINPLKWVSASILVALVTLGSALYPAWRASRFQPAEAMRFYE